MAFRQSKGSTIGIIKTGETVQHKFDSLDASIENLTNLINGKQGNGGGENVGTPWMYTAVGGETSFVVGFSGTIVRIPYLFINGIRQDLTTNFTYNSSTKTISLLNTQLVAGDSVTVVVMDDTNPTMTKLASTDGAGYVGLKQGGKVQDGLGCVYASTFGVYMQPTATISGGSPVDMTSKLQAAIDKAKSLKVPLVLDVAEEVGPSTSQFIYVTKTIDISGLREIRGALLIAILPETFTPTYSTPDTPPRGVVLKNLNGRYDSSGKQYFTSTRGGQTFDTIAVASLRDYTDEKLIGQLHTTCYSHFNGQLWGRRFGTGIRFANTYDCSFSGQVACVDSGSINYYPLEVGSFPYVDRADESNSLTFPRILVHTNKYRDASIVGSKINVTAIHAEECTVGDITNLTPNGFDSFAPNGIASLVFGLTGGSIGNIDYNIKSSTSTNNGCLLVNMLGTSVSEIYTDDKTDILLSDVYFLGRGGSVGSIYSDSDVYTGGGSPLSISNLVTTKNLNNAGVRTKIDYAKVGGNVTLNAGIIDFIECTGNITQNQYGHIKGGSCKDFTMSNSSKLEYFTISGTYTSAAPSPVLTNVVFSGTFNNTGGGSYNRCTIPAFGISSTTNVPTYNFCNISGNVTVAVDNARAIFNDCSVGTYNLNNAVNTTIRINRGSSGGISMTGVTGAVLIDYTHFCTAGTAIAGWAAPTVTSVGYGAKTVNPYTAKGFTLSWNGTAAQWFPMTLA